VTKVTFGSKELVEVLFAVELPIFLAEVVGRKGGSTFEAHKVVAMEGCAKGDGHFLQWNYVLINQ